ncbi:hypothetical protein PDIDSM_1342 [Penicillium digitatum]|nr:hypothetical protein PDIDSM_1342 [Penicillium digitatum]
MASRKELARAMKRLGDEIRAYDNVENETFLFLRPVNDENLLHWEAVLKGPAGSAYEGGLWHLSIEIPPKYPFAPPTIIFTNKILHPNIDFNEGKICLSVLTSEHWTPAGNLETTLRAIQQLLTDPNPDSPLNVEISVLLRKGDIAGYESLVRYLTEEQRWEEPRNPRR